MGDGRHGAALLRVLGQTGIGKTTTCRLLARRLIDRRRSGAEAPLPIYLDLRRLDWDGTAGFTLQTILESVLARGYKLGSEAPPSAEDVVVLLRRQGALAICDGLDEVIVHMSPKLGQDLSSARSRSSARSTTWGSWRSGRTRCR